MKAVILNSGTGTRVKPLTDHRPKCLLEVNGKTILARQMECLRDCGVAEFLITTGPFEEKIIEHNRQNFPGLSVEYIRNPLYAETNYIYSLWLARQQLQGEILLLHGDLVFDCDLLRELIELASGNYVLVNRSIGPPREDFKARIVEGRVREIGVKLSGPDAYFLAPIYRMTASGFQLWLGEIERFVARGMVSVYAEDAFNVISDQLELKPHYYHRFNCMEVDSLQDLKLAQDLFP